MPRLVPGVAATLMLMVVLVPVQGQDPSCSTGDPLGGLLQDDAGSGHDAGDGMAGALVLPEGLYTGMLQVPTVAGQGDAADWFGLLVAGPAAAVMVELQAYSAEPATAGLFVVDVVPSGHETPVAVVPLGAERTAFPAVDGSWSFRVRSITDPGTSCESSAGLAAPDAIAGLMPNYTLYIGCDPICV